MLVGAARVDISPWLPADLLGYVRRAHAAREVARPLLVTACLLRDETSTVVVAAADVVGLSSEFADRARRSIAEAVSCRPEDVLLNSSHSHAAPWPGALWKLGGEFDEWTAAERAYEEWLPSAYASAAVMAAERAVTARVSGGVGRVSGLAVNRRERTPDGHTILGWNPDGFVDEEVPVLRLDAPDGSPVATMVGFGCHPVVVGPDVAKAGPDFVGPLRDRVEALRGGTCLFLQGAAGNVLPLEAFLDHEGPEVAFGHRLALEALHAVADRDPRATVVQKLDYGSVTPISLYRRQLSVDQPHQPLQAVSRRVRLPLLPPPGIEELERELAERRAELGARRARGEGRATMNPVAYHVHWLEHTLDGAREGALPTEVEGEMWAARIGDCAIVGAPGEIFSEIGYAVRTASPAAVTIFAGYSQGVLGYVATPEEHAHGGYEPAVSHRGYGPPAPFAPETAGIIRTTSLDLLAGLFESTGCPPRARGFGR